MQDEERKAIQLGSEVEALMQHPAWKYIQTVWHAMYVDIVGGVSDGKLIDGMIDDKDLKDRDYFLGYRKALAELWKRTILFPINVKNEILQRYEETEKTTHVERSNPYENEPGML